jgi:hypothetical protein
MTEVLGMDGDFWRGVIAAIILVLILYACIALWVALT